MIETPLARTVIGIAIKVHRALGPGLLERSYVACLSYEFVKHGIPFRSEVPMPLTYEGVVIDCGYRLDLVVANQLILEVKSVARLLPVHDAIVLTYLKLSGLPQARLLNFNVTMMRDGIKSFLRRVSDDGADSGGSSRPLLKRTLVLPRPVKLGSKSQRLTGQGQESGRRIPAQESRR
jgi:GxxExxY protein